MNKQQPFNAAAACGTSVTVSKSPFIGTAVVQARASEQCGGNATIIERENFFVGGGQSSVLNTRMTSNRLQRMPT
jgi:hypothetical protein